MLTSLKTFWLYGAKYLSVEVCSREGSEHYQGVQAMRKKGEFDSLEFFRGDTLSQLATEVGGKRHCWLVINTDQVLTRSAPIIEDDAQMLAEAFPGLDQNEFFAQVLRGKETGFAWVCRREYIEQLINSFEDQGLFVIGFHLGFSSISGLLPSLSQEVVRTTTHRLHIEEDQVTAFDDQATTPPKSYRIGGEDIASDFLLASGGLLAYEGSLPNVSGNLNQQIETLAEDHNRRVFFKKGLVIGSAVLLLLLLLNALLFSSYYDKLQALNEQSGLLASQKENYTKRVEQVEHKQQIVENILRSGSSKGGFYLNRIVTSMPTSLRLNRLIYQPLEKSIRPDKSIEIRTRQIQVEAQGANNEYLGEWIKQLELFDWTESVAVSQFEQPSTGTALFTIMIQLNDETEN